MSKNKKLFLQQIEGKMQIPVLNSTIAEYLYDSLSDSLTETEKQNIVLSIFKADTVNQMSKNLYQSRRGYVPECPYKINSTVMCRSKTYKYFDVKGDGSEYKDEYVEVGKAKLIDFNAFSSEPFYIEYEKMNSQGKYFTVNIHASWDEIYPTEEGLGDAVDEVLTGKNIHLKA